MKPLKEQIEELLNKLELMFDYEEEAELFTFDIQTKYAVVSTIIAYDENKMIIENVGYVPVCLPKENTTELLYLINKIHNESDGRCCFCLEENNKLLAKSLIDIPKEGINEEVFNYFVFSTCDFFDQYYNEFMTIAFKKATDDEPKNETGEKSDSIRSILILQGDKTSN